jgi:hypothetical protein
VSQDEDSIVARKASQATRPEKENAGQAEQKLRESTAAKTLERAKQLRALGEYEQGLAALAQIPADAVESGAAAELRQRIQADMAQARAFLGEVREAIADWQRTEAVQRLLEAAAALVREKRFEEARSSLMSGLQEFPDETELRQALNSANSQCAAYERAQAIERALHESGQLAGTENREQALGVVKEALARYPDNAELRERIRILEQERLRRAGPAMEAGQGQFPGQEQPERDIREGPTPQAANEQLRLTAQKRAIAAGRRSASALGKGGKLTAMVALLEKLCEQYPDSIRLKEDLQAASLRLDEAINVGRCKANALLGTNNLSEAVGLLDRLCGLYPRSEQLKQDREVAVSSLRSAIEEGRREVARRLESSDFEGAATLLDRLSESFPDSAEIKQDRAKVLRALSDYRREREQAVTSGRLQAADLIKTGDPAAAIAILDQLRLRYPETSLDQDRDVAASALEQQLERAAQLAKQEVAIRDRQEDAARFARQRDFRAAVEILENLAREFPDRTAIQENLVAARASYEQHLRDERTRLEAEQQRLRRQREEIAKGRAEAAELVVGEDFAQAIEVLARLAERHPGAREIQADLDTAFRGYDLKRQREEEAERDAERTAISAAREEAAAAARAGQHRQALALLEKLRLRYPQNAEIRHDLERTQSDLRRKHVEEGIEATRREATSLAQSGDLRSAIAVLNTLAETNPNHAGVLRDRDVFAAEAEQQRVKAEERAHQALEALAARKQDESEAFARATGEAAPEGGQVELESKPDRLPPEAATEGEFGDSRDQFTEAEERARRALAVLSQRRSDLSNAGFPFSLNKMRALEDPAPTGDWLGNRFTWRAIRGRPDIEGAADLIRAASEKVRTLIREASEKVRDLIRALYEKVRDMSNAFRNR